MLFGVALLGATVVDAGVVVLAAVTVETVVAAAVVAGVGVVVPVGKFSVGENGDSRLPSCSCNIVVGYSSVCLVVVVGSVRFVQLGEIKRK